MARALSVRFMDHALGSLIFLYSMDIPANTWLSAIPLTLIERTTMAAGLSIATYVALHFFSEKPVISPDASKI